jgi:hypothetical protein
MAQHQTVEGFYGPGSHVDAGFLPLPEDTRRILRVMVGQIKNHQVSEEQIDAVEFTGSDDAIIPGAIKSQATVAALYALAGIFAADISKTRYGTSNKVTVNTDHAGLFLGIPALATAEGAMIPELFRDGRLKQILPSYQQGWYDTPLLYKTTSIYQTKNPKVWYQLHGSLQAKPMMRSIGVDPELPIKTVPEAYAKLQEHVRQFTGPELEYKDVTSGMCGSICYTPAAWANTYMGKALSRHPLVNVNPVLMSDTAPVPFPPATADKRPLAGVKVVELSRVIAGPTIGMVLAAFGADVIRINAEKLIDIDVMQLTLNAGKTTIALDLDIPEQKAKLESLIADADVFIQGFRLQSMTRRGLGLDQLAAKAKARGRGIIYVDENCFGPDGPYAERPGWQQIADAAVGCSYITGRSLRRPDNECVLPPLPISDLCTGVTGAVGVLKALRDRAQTGGSHHIITALAGFNMFTLKPEVGLYPQEVVDRIAKRFEWGPMTAQGHVFDLLFTVTDAWEKKVPEWLDTTNNTLWSTWEQGPFGKTSLLNLPCSLDQNPIYWTSPSKPYCYSDASKVDFAHLA